MNEKGKFKMKLRQFDGTQECKILTYLIVSKEFLEATPFIKGHHFANSYGQKLYRWCRDFFRQYNDAPSSHILDIYVDNYPDDDPDDPEQDYIKKQLTKLSGEWEKRKEFNLQFAVENALDFANKKELELLEENLKLAREANNREEALRLINNFKPITIEGGDKTGEDPFNDLVGWEEAFNNDNQEVLFELPGVFGEFLGEQLYRESLIGILAKEKAGKSYLLSDIGYQALRYGRSVALFEAGDMTKSQRYYRIAQHYTHLPRKRKRPGKDFQEYIDVNYPMDFEGNTEVRRLHNLTKELALEAISKQAKLMERRFKSKLKQAYYTTSTLTFSEIERKLKEWEANEGFIPDVILIDYPDIMLAENMKLDVRHQENQKWKSGRHLSQKYRACVIMVTQADAESYEKDWLALKNFSESKTKYAHVTAFIGLNKKAEDEQLNRVRLNYLMPPREGSKMPNIQILQCLECGVAYIDSRWMKNKPGIVVHEGEEERDFEGDWKKKSGKGDKAKKYFMDNPVSYSLKEAAKISGAGEDHCRKIRRELVEQGEL